MTFVKDYRIFGIDRLDRTRDETFSVSSTLPLLNAKNLCLRLPTFPFWVLRTFPIRLSGSSKDLNEPNLDNSRLVPTIITEGLRVLFSTKVQGETDTIIFLGSPYIPRRVGLSPRTSFGSFCFRLCFFLNG